MIEITYKIKIKGVELELTQSEIIELESRLKDLRGLPMIDERTFLSPFTQIHYPIATTISCENSDGEKYKRIEIDMNEYRKMRGW